ncbi:MAG: serine hydrolase domain-containing protein [Vicinamibacteria bacterium]
MHRSPRDERGGLGIPLGLPRLALVLLWASAPLAFAQDGSFSWIRATPEEVGMDRAQLLEARDYALLGREDPHRGGSGMVTRRGKLVLSWGSPTALYQIKSATKGVGVSALGLAILDGRMALNDRAKSFHPTLGFPPASNAETGWLDQITLFHLATMTSGFAHDARYGPMRFEPGTKWSYSNAGADWLGECLTLEYGQDLETLLFERVFTPLGITKEHLTWGDNDYRPDRIEGIKRRELASGIRANIDALARIGYLYLRRGEWNGKRILPESFVLAVSTSPPEVRGLPLQRERNNPGASMHYGLLWWNNSDGAIADVPKDAFWAWGGMMGRDTETLILVMPSLDIVVARAGTGWGDGTIDYKFLEPFLAPIARSAAARPPS